MTTTTKYLYRHLYIPLSREELEINNVHTLEEYDKFLAELFMGNKLLNKAHKEVITTATKEFKSKEENNDDIVLHMIYTDFYIGWYFFFIVAGTLFGSLFSVAIQSEYQNISTLTIFLCVYSLFLLFIHLFKITIVRLECKSDRLSFFKIARIQNKKH